MASEISKILPIYRKARRASLDSYIIVARALVSPEHFPLLISHRWFYHSPDHSPYLQVLDESKNETDPRTGKELHFTSCLFLNRVVYALGRGIGLGPSLNPFLDLQALLRSMPEIQRLAPLNRDWFDCRLENISSKISKRSQGIRDEKAVQRMLLDSERLTLEERRDESSLLLPSPEAKPLGVVPNSSPSPTLSPYPSKPISLKGVLDEFDIPDTSSVVPRTVQNPLEEKEVPQVQNPLASPKKDED